MKTIKLEGSIKEHALKNITKINELNNTISDLSSFVYKERGKLWALLRKEYPGLSENSKVEKKEDEILLIDLLSD